MKKKNNYFLDLHKKWMETGKLPSGGLCNSIKGHYLIFSLVAADDDERCQLLDEGFDYTYWGSGLKMNHKDEEYKYTPLRQTIVLFCHEILNS